MKTCRILWNKLWCHVGVGKFHRAHQAKCIDTIRKLNHIQSDNWSIIGVGLKRQDKSIIYDLKKQDYCYTLKEVSKYEKTISVIESIQDIIYVPNEKDKLNLLLDDELKCISMTITEDGYYLDSNHNLLPSQDLICDLNIMKHHKPYTIYGFLHYVLYHRFLLNLPGLFIMSCDNIMKNSAVLYDGFLQYLDKVNIKNRKRYMLWIENEITFPITMVDRITPNTNNHGELDLEDGLNDTCSITSESYLKWVIEDKFVTKSGLELTYPPFNMINGVTIDKNTDIHQKMKLYFVNGGHLIIAFYGMVNDCVYVMDAMKQDKCRGLLEKYFQSIFNTFSKDEQIKYNIHDYINTVKDRFENPHILDTIERLCLYGGIKVKYVMNDLVVDSIVDLTNHMFIPIRLYLEYINHMKDRRDFLMKYDLVGMNLLDNIENENERINAIFFSNT